MTSLHSLIAISISTIGFLPMKTNKDYSQNINSTINNNVDISLIQFLDHKASFKGGEIELKKYLQHFIDKSSNSLIQDHAYGSCIISFIVDKDGNCKNASSSCNTANKLAEIGKSAILNSPPWNPATTKGKAVASVYSVTIAFHLSDDIGIKYEPK